MSTNSSDFDEPSTEELEAVSRMLRDPAVWAEPSDGVEDRVLAAITAESEGWEPPTGLPTDDSIDVATVGVARSAAQVRASAQAEATPIGQFRRSTPPADDVDSSGKPRRRFVPLLAAAALVVAILGAVAALNLNNDSGSSDGELVALSGTELAPDASGVAQLIEQPDGLQIMLQVSDLDPAPPGSYYEAWLAKPGGQIAIGAGSFHLRGGGDAEIELWAGVLSTEYPIVTVTLESEADPGPPGQLVLIGEMLPAPTD